MNLDIARQNPFVGLRPFENRDSLYYFGRKEQTHALLKQLYTNRFVAVVGSSGCGKSSLVRAGLIPNLEAGFLVQDRDLWEIATFKPGDAPLYHLVASLASLSGSDSSDVVGKLLETVQRRGAQALVELAQTILKGEDSNVLIVVDQFEELFRFQQTRTTRVREEAADFVSILLHLAKQTVVPIYVVLTMRSDFLGECDAYQGLPEAMNNSQYLVPRLTRQQRREAFLGPIRLAGADMTPRLMDRLLNESLDTRDDLPVLQHALMRTWTVWADNGRNGAIDLEHYERAGTLKNALRLHADEALKDLDEENRLISKRMFQALTETDAANRRIRRPALLSQIVAICGKKVRPQNIRSLIERFNVDDRNFLVLSSRASADNPLVDISHESLIRQWKTLAKWVDEEAESARIYQRLAQSAELNAEGKAGLYKETDLQVALDWQRQQRPNSEWADRYDSKFSLTMGFLEQSVKKQKTNKMFIISFLVCAYTCIYAWLVIATTDDVSLATNSLSLPIIGTRMRADLVYLVSPLVMISIYAWFLFHLQRLVLILSSQPKASKEDRSLTAWMEAGSMKVLAWITVPAAFIGLWVDYLLRRDWTVTSFHIIFVTLAICMAVFFQRTSRPGEQRPAPLKQQTRRSGIVRVALVPLIVLVVFTLSLGVFKGSPERDFLRKGDVYALVPWLFHQVGYDVFFDFKEQNVSKLPDNFWSIESKPENKNAIRGALLKKTNLRYADMYQAFVVKANLRNSELRGARLREADFRNADLRGANLNGADLRQGNFQRADFREAKLTEVNLGDADLRGAQLGFADLKEADLFDAKLAGADLRCADLLDVKNLSIEDLQTVKTLYRAKMDEVVRQQMQINHKELFAKPPDTWFDMTTPYNVDTKDICE
ncbi:MAG: pentapeptide repeat-containing protein [Deltaproteobacteria bacterium]|nr:pentapeptide repeat-containing protein [Deltaproteobacteria bacterium]